MILKLTFPSSLFVFFFKFKISLQFPRNTTRGGRVNRDRYVKQDHAEFILTGLRINPGRTVHTTRHVIPSLGPSVYFFLCCLNCLDLLIVKPQVKGHTRHLQPAYAPPPPTWPGEVCHLPLWDEEGWKILKLFFLITRILDSSLILSLFSISVTHVLSPHLCSLCCFSAWFLSHSLFFFFADTSRKWLYSQPIRRSKCNSFFFFFEPAPGLFTAVCRLSGSVCEYISGIGFSQQTFTCSHTVFHASLGGGGAARTASAVNSPSVVTCVSHCDIKDIQTTFRARSHDSDRSQGIHLMWWKLCLKGNSTNFTH